MEKQKRICIFAYSNKGCKTALRIAGAMTEGQSRDSDGHDNKVQLYTVSRLSEKNREFSAITAPSAAVYRKEFEQSGVLVFVGALGIAVRNISPYVNDKKTDPAVICVDELAKFVIPVLSGHIGGANALAARLSQALGAVPVITTATDINGRFSVDTWAVNAGLIIDNMITAKEISAEILERDIPVVCDFPVESSFPPGIYSADEAENITDAGNNGSAAYPGRDTGIYIGFRKSQHFRRTLRLIPVILHLGIGCRKGIACSAVTEAVQKFLDDNNLDARSVSGVYTIDIKKDEPGLREFCDKKGWKLHTYTAEELNRTEGEFSSSDFVRGITGTDNVCERAAMQGAEKLVVRKTAANGVTVAAAAEYFRVSF